MTRALLVLVSAVALALAGVMLVPAALGMERYVITSGSMTGSYDRGSIVYADEVPVAELEVGDAITYVPPPDTGKPGRLTHRIVTIERSGGGPPILRTKGDANRGADPWKFVLDRPTQARVAFHVPYVGFAFAALAERKFRMFAVGLPALLVALGALSGLWRAAGDAAAAERRERIDGAPAPLGAVGGLS